MGEDTRAMLGEIDDLRDEVKQLQKNFDEGCDELQNVLKEKMSLFEDCKQLQAEVEKNRWIPVSERLPEHGDNVWVCIDGDKHYAWTQRDVWSRKNKEWLFNPRLNITHWEPIILP